MRHGDILRAVTHTNCVSIHTLDTRDITWTIRDNLAEQSPSVRDGADSENGACRER